MIQRNRKLSTLLKVFIILFLILSTFQISCSQPSVERFPKGIVQIPIPKLLDFGRGICIPCKTMAPILQELSEEYKGRVIIKIIEIDQEPGLTRANRIRLIPTQIFFDSKNEEIYRHEGFMGKDQIKEVFRQMGVK